MRDFRSGRGGFGRSSGRRFNDRSGRFGGRDRFGDRDRRETEMFDATCSKCGKECQVPFKPTGSKPVLCSDCFRKGENSRDNGPKNNENSNAQFEQINAKLDKILHVLQELEMDVDEDIDDESEETPQ